MNCPPRRAIGVEGLEAFIVRAKAKSYVGDWCHATAVSGWFP